MKRIIFISILIIIAFCTFAQKETPLVRKGNSNYEQKNYTEAEKLYRKAIETNKKSTKGFYNLGNSLYKQNRFTEATKIYDTLLNNAQIEESLKAKLYHNLGNTYLNEAINNKTLQNEQKQELAKKSIEAYKKSLRLNPKDLDTKYNLQYANKLVQKLQNQQNQQNKNNQNQKDQQKNQNNKDNKKDDQNQNKDNQNNKSDQNKDKKDSENKNANGNMSKEDAERMLNAVQNKEKQTLENVDKVDNAEKAKIIKDW